MTFCNFTRESALLNTDFVLWQTSVIFIQFTKHTGEAQWTVTYLKCVGDVILFLHTSILKGFTDLT